MFFLSSERSTQLEDGTINSIDKNYDVSPLLMSSCRSEKWTPVNTCDYDSPLSLKKEPKCIFFSDFIYNNFEF